jgi:hypothetical protein
MYVGMEVYLHLYITWALDTLSESYRTVIVVTASVKEDEREGQGHTSESLLRQYAT